MDDSMMVRSLFSFRYLWSSIKLTSILLFSIPLFACSALVLLSGIGKYQVTNVAILREHNSALVASRAWPRIVKLTFADGDHDASDDHAICA